MTVEIFNNNLTLNLYGFSAIAPNKDYVQTAFQLMDRMWKVVRSNNLKNSGLNVWVFEAGDNVFSGVGLAETPAPTLGLEQKTINLTKYASYKHVGPYSMIKQAGHDMRKELQKMGYEAAMPYIEIYGHMTEDETRLETELLVALK
ncbi:MAG: GyrI-like domain-containing protein [Bacteroidetes bacterium]|nr:GyrI-like domain-containing protein [Bacteroidota bacterium]